MKPTSKNGQLSPTRVLFLRRRGDKFLSTCYNHVLRPQQQNFPKHQEVWSLPFLCRFGNLGVNFTDILRAALLPFCFALKKCKPNFKYKKSFTYNFCTKKRLIKCWWNWHLDESFESSKICRRTVERDYIRFYTVAKTRNPRSHQKVVWFWYPEFL